jgi:(p)ppGpp synthase/HD superfamily hydrolase
MNCIHFSSDVTPLLTKARRYACLAHAKNGQMYGNMPYVYHLSHVENTLRKFKINDDELYIAAWLHDILEDTDVTFDELEKEFGHYIAHIVNCVTEPKIGTRKKRHIITYPKIRSDKRCVILKLADRIANVETGALNDMYK